MDVEGKRVFERFDAENERLAWHADILREHLYWQIVAEEAAADEQEYLPVARAERRPGWKN